jgi:hypothetical protein
MRLPKLVSVRAFETDQRDTITFQFQSQDGRSHYVPLKAGVLNALLPAIMNVRQSMGDSEQPSSAQPVTLTGAKAAFHEDGTPMMAITLDGVALLISLDQPDAISILQAALDTLRSREAQSYARH